VLGTLVVLSSVLDTTAVPPVRSINVAEPQLQLITSFLTSSFEARSGSKAVNEGATESLEAVAFGLGDDGGLPILLKVRRVNPAGEILASAELRVLSLDELPTVCDRLVESVIKAVPLPDTRNRHNVAMAETGVATRMGTEKVLGVKLWFGAPFAAQANLNTIGAIMFDGRFERETYFFELGAGFVIPGPSTSLTSEGYGGFLLELGASKYLSSGDTAVYAGAGLMPRLLLSGAINDSPLNLAPYGQFGVMFDRASSTRLYADLRVAQNIIPVRLNNGAGGVLRSAYPTELTAAVGIGW
jgi:hypothetical protein